MVIKVVNVFELPEWVLLRTMSDRESFDSRVPNRRVPPKRQNRPCTLLDFRECTLFEGKEKFILCSLLVLHLLMKFYLEHRTQNIQGFLKRDKTNNLKFYILKSGPSGGWEGDC